MGTPHYKKPRSGTPSITELKEMPNVLTASTLFRVSADGLSVEAVTPAQLATALVAGEGAVPAAIAATVAATEYGSTAMHRTVLTLTDMPQAVVNGTEYQGTKIYTFPEGRIHVFGVVATIAQKTTSTIASTLHASSVGALSIGSVTASSTTLDSTMVDLLPSTAFASSATINVAGTAVSAVLAAAAVFDGHTTALAAFINTAYATTADVAADATQTLTGTITITWANLGDF